MSVSVASDVGIDIPRDVWLIGSYSAHRHFHALPGTGTMPSMSRKAFFWFEFAVIVGGNVIMLVGQHPYGLIVGAALVGLGCVMLFRSTVRQRKTAEPENSEASRTIH